MTYAGRESPGWSGVGFARPRRRKTMATLALGVRQAVLCTLTSVYDVIRPLSRCLLTEYLSVNASMFSPKH